MIAQENLAIWQAPLITVKTAAKALDVPTIALRKLLDACGVEIILIDRVEWFRPIDAGHKARALKGEDHA